MMKFRTRFKFQFNAITDITSIYSIRTSNNFSSVIHNVPKRKSDPAWSANIFERMNNRGSVESCDMPRGGQDISKLNMHN